VEEEEGGGSTVLWVGGGIAGLFAVGGVGAGGWWAYRRYRPNARH
jgi:hypothetical protein